ncbi:24380_t:CDS:2, partial [Racocetra persica]
EKKNNQYAQKHEAANAKISCISMEDFFSILETMKHQNIENFKQTISIHEYAPIDPKEIASHIKDPKKREDPTKHKDHLPMQRFHCGGWLTITINTKKNQVNIKLTHEYHTEYIDVHVTNEVKEYIQNNIQQTPRMLWENICAKNINITEKQIYRWWMNFNQYIWKKDEDQIYSAIKIISAYKDIEIMMHRVDNEVTLICFGITEIIHCLGVNIAEIGVDAI